MTDRPVALSPGRLIVPAQLCDSLGGSRSLCGVCVQLLGLFAGHPQVRGILRAGASSPSVNVHQRFDVHGRHAPRVLKDQRRDGPKVPRLIGKILGGEA